MRYAHIYSRLIGAPWFVDLGTLSGITQLLQARINHESAHADVSALVVPEKSKSQNRGVGSEGVAVIPIFGVIGKHLSAMESICGGVDMDAIRESVDQAMADPSVKSVLMYFDSPGGQAIGCHELFTHLVNSKTKPLYAYTDTVLGSAAYYIASAADAIYSSPTARVGSIGSMLIVMDQSEKNAKDGVKFTIFKSGEHKGMGHSSQPLTKDQVGITQDLVSQLGARFRADVGSVRPSIAAADMEGLAYLGTEAKAKGFVDDVANDLPALLAQLR